MTRRCSIVLVAVLAFATRLGAATITDNEHHFSVSLPAGWSRITDAELRAVPGITKGFVAGARSDDGGLPYCVIEAVRRPTGDPAEHVADLRKDAEDPGLTVDEVRYDRQRQAFIITARAESIRGPVAMITYAFVGKDIMVAIHCYALAPDLETSRPIFETLANTFHFDAGYTFDDSGPGVGRIIRIGLWVVLLLLYPVMGRRKRARPNASPTLPHG